MTAWTRANLRSWGDWHDRLRKKWLWFAGFSQRIADTDQMTFDEMKAYLAQVEREFAPAVDRVIQKYADTGRWPPQANDHAYFLARRLEWALLVLSIQGRQIYRRPPLHGGLEAIEAVEPPCAPPDIIARWLLIETWQDFGRDDWIRRRLLDESE